MLEKIEKNTMQIKIKPKIKIAVVLLLILIAIQFLGIIILFKIAFGKVIYIWLMPQTFQKNQYVINQMPDTFDSHIIIKTDVPVYLYVLNSSQFINFGAGKYFSAIKTLNGKNFNFWFNISAGCGDYLYVIQAINNTSFTVYPDVTAVYHPSLLSGECKNFT